MALTLESVTWVDLIEDVSPKKPKMDDMKKAIKYLQESVGFSTPGDAVGADEAELQAASLSTEWLALSATARTIAKRGVGGANAM